jgi:hypothetical protein
MPWTPDDDLRLSLVMGLRKGLKQIRGMRRSLTEDQQDRVANEIAKHLRLSNWRIEKGPPAPPLSTSPFMYPSDDRKK